MQKKTKFLFTLLVGISSGIGAYAQNSKSEAEESAFARQLRSYAYLTTLPFSRILARPPRLTHAQEVVQDNELVHNKIGQEANFQCNPLQVNGKPLDYDTFDTSTKGVLSVVKDNPNSKEAQRIPFYVSIRRDGKIVKDKKMSFLNKSLYQINLSDIFPFTGQGDVLIINPVKAEDWKAKRILKLLGGC